MVQSLLSCQTLDIALLFAEISRCQLHHFSSILFTIYRINKLLLILRRKQFQTVVVVSEEIKLQVNCVLNFRVAQEGLRVKVIEGFKGISLELGGAIVLNDNVGTGGEDSLSCLLC
jgi:hypothetical protein